MLMVYTYWCVNDVLMINIWPWWHFNWRNLFVKNSLDQEKMAILEWIVYFMPRQKLVSSDLVV